MNSVLKALILLPLRLANAYAHAVAVARWRPSAGFAWTDVAYGITRDSRVTVHHPMAGGLLDTTVDTPNEVCRYRTDIFSTKEPETLEWIDRFGGDGAFYAFEPSVLNLGLPSTRNYINDLSNHGVIVPNPLASVNQVAQHNRSMLDDGGSNSTLGVERHHDGGALEDQLAYGATGMKLDCMVKPCNVPRPPTMIKIYVDGIEQLSLRGADKELAVSGITKVTIEDDEDFRILAKNAQERLRAAGLTLVERRHEDMFASGVLESTFDQIWVRNSMSGHPEIVIA